MNEEIQKRMLESFDSVVKYIETTKDFVAEQAPIVVNEMLNYGYYKAILILCIGCSILIFTKLLYFIAIRNIWKDTSIMKDDKIGWTLISTIISFIISIICIVSSAPSILTLIKINTAPRLYVLEQIQNLM